MVARDKDMSSRLVSLPRIVRFLDDYFRVNDVESDPAFSRFVPMVYDPIGFPWRVFFELEFAKRFNGLMMRGSDTVGRIWCVSFPSAGVLDHILPRSHPGDLIFSHHPIDMECDDPRGEKGRGFVPILPERLHAIRDRGLSFYSCHIPLDTHTEISTSDALVRLIGGVVTNQFLPVGCG
jgi:hypothetical protein